MIEWQIAEGSRVAHLVDTTKPAARWSGPRSECGRYPQRNREAPWFSLSSTETGTRDAIRSYSCRECPDCAERLAA